MTHVEALKQVIEELGGRARLIDIYPRVVKLVHFKEGSDIKATLRSALLRHPLHFRQSPGMPDGGWWELVSYQEEMAALKNRVAVLELKVEQLMAIPKEAEFVEKFLQEIMDEYKRRRKEADPIRNILRHMGHEEAAAVLDAWIDEKEDELKTAFEKLKIQIRNIMLTGEHATYNENNK